MCAPESTSFGPDKGVLRWFGGAWVCPKTNQFRTGERSQMPRLLLHESPFAPAGNPPSPCRQCQETNGLPCWIQGTTLPVGGKGGTVARSAGCCHEIETPAGECLRRITITRQSASYFFLAKFAKCGIVTMSTGSLSSLPRPGL